MGSKLTGKGSKGETGEGQDIALFLTKARAEHSLRMGNRTPELGRYRLVHSHGSAQLGGPPSRAPGRAMDVADLKRKKSRTEQNMHCILHKYTNQMSFSLSQVQKYPAGRASLSLLAREVSQNFSAMSEMSLLVPKSFLNPNLAVLKNF